MTHEHAENMMSVLKSMEQNLQALRETNSIHNSRLMEDMFNIEQGIIDMEKFVEEDSDILEVPLNLEKL